MKKTIFALAAFAALAMGCAKEQQPSDTPADQGKVTTIRVTVAQTKVAVDETTGACTWQEGDKIGIWYQGESKGQRIDFTYAGLHEDGSAQFTTTTEIPEGYVAAKVTYPASSINPNTGAWNLVKEYDFKLGFVPVYLRTENITTDADGNLSAQLYHNAAIMKFTLEDMPSYAAGLVVETKRTEAAGGSVISVKTKFPCNSQELELCSPVAYNSYPDQIYLIDAGGEKIEGTVKRFQSSEDKLLVAGDYIIMPAVDFDAASLPARNYVNIKGVKFAKGNLQYVSGEGQTGFQDGWRIAPAQWHHLAYKLLNSTTGNTTSYDGSERVDIRTTNSSDAFEHFNGGGIGANSRLLTDYITPSSTSAFEMSGKVYSDITAETILTGDDQFVATGTLYGDVAFWASKGVWRMPKASELKYLHNETHKISAKYVTSDGYTVWGWFFYPIVAEDRIQGDNKITITDKDLEYGLFLPNAGRRAEKNESVIFYITKQGSYRTGTYIKSNDSKFYSAYYHSNDGSGYLYDDKLYGSNQNIAASMSHMAAYSIRPVLVD